MRKKLKAGDEETANSQQKMKEQAAEKIAKKAAESEKLVADLKSQVKELEEVVKNNLDKLADSAKSKSTLVTQLKAAKDRHKTLAQARITVSKELAKTLKEKSDLEEDLKTNVEEVNKAKVIQVGLGCKQAQVNLPRLNEKDLDQNDLELLKSPTVIALEEANEDLTGKYAALENKFNVEMKFRESLENEVKEDKSLMDLVTKSNETLMEEVDAYKSKVLFVENEKKELLEIKEKYESLEKTMQDEIKT